MSIVSSFPSSSVMWWCHPGLGSPSLISSAQTSSDPSRCICRRFRVPLETLPGPDHYEFPAAERRPGQWIPLRNPAPLLSKVFCRAWRGERRRGRGRRSWPRSSARGCWLPAAAMAISLSPRQCERKESSARGAGPCAYIYTPATRVAARPAWFTCSWVKGPGRRRSIAAESRHSSAPATGTGGRRSPTPAATWQAIGLTFSRLNAAARPTESSPTRRPSRNRPRP